MKSSQKLEKASKFYDFDAFLWCARQKRYTCKPLPARGKSCKYGLSHGLKIARQLSIFAPVCAWNQCMVAPGNHWDFYSLRGAPLVPPFHVPLFTKEKKKAVSTETTFSFLVREAGLEPARPQWTLEPESSESTNSTTRAYVVGFRSTLEYISTAPVICQQLFSLFQKIFC